MNSRIVYRAVIFFIAILILLCTGIESSTRNILQNKSESQNSISGKLVADDGQQMDDCIVFLTSQGRAVGRLNGVYTNANGEFFFHVPEQSVYVLSSSCKGYVTAFGLDTREQLHCSPGDNLTVRMTKGGVITGRVTNLQGDPMVRLTVQAVAMRDLQDRTFETNEAVSRKTDDRGIYRLYGLRPGVYLVRASGDLGDGTPPGLSPYSNVAPAFYPTGGRATAKEISVTAGAEINGIDIIMTDEVGHTIQGTVAEAPSPAQSIVQVRLGQLPTGTVETMYRLQTGMSGEFFVFTGVADGDYEVIATIFSQNNGNALSRAQRVSVRGADVSGVRLSAPVTGSVSGSVTIEDDPVLKALDTCVKRPPPAFENVLITAHPMEKFSPLESLYHHWNLQAAVDRNGTFTLNGLFPGGYVLDGWLPREDLFIKSISYSPGKKATETASSKTLLDKLTIKTGEKSQGSSIVIGNGAASIRGTLKTENMRVLLIPTETDAETQSWRYYETAGDADGKFTIKNIMPGIYSAIVLEPTDLTSKWDAAGRAKLKTIAGQKGTRIELKPCSKNVDLVLTR